LKRQVPEQRIESKKKKGGRKKEKEAKERGRAR
jgi:hypothetical protein